MLSLILLAPIAIDPIFTLLLELFLSVKLTFKVSESNTLEPGLIARSDTSCTCDSSVLVVPNQSLNMRQKFRLP